MKAKSVFTVVGMIVFAVVALIVLYFAWVGWRSRGKPVPDVDVDRTKSSLHWHQPDPALA